MLLTILDVVCILALTFMLSLCLPDRGQPSLHAISCGPYSLQVDVAVFKGAAASDPAGKPWWDGIDQNLSKLFMGPAGTITRLHFDCGDAHAWLGQVRHQGSVRNDLLGFSVRIQFGVLRIYKPSADSVAAWQGNLCPARSLWPRQGRCWGRPVTDVTSVGRVGRCGGLHCEASGRTRAPHQGSKAKVGEARAKPLPFPCMHHADPN